MNEELRQTIEELQRSILRHEQEIADVWKYMDMTMHELSKLVETLKKNMYGGE